MTVAAASLTLVSVAIFVHFSRSAQEVAISEAINTYPTASGSGRGCLVLFIGSDVTVCTFGATDLPTKTIVLFGDSHADHWSSPLVDIATKRGWRVVTVMKALCPAADFGVFVERLQRISTECQAWRASAIERIVALRPDLIIIGEASTAYVRSAEMMPSASWPHALARTLERFNAAKLPVLLMSVTPRHRESASICLARVVWRAGDEARCATAIDRVSQAVIATERATVAHLPAVTYHDWTARFCPAARCPAVIDGVVVYRDTNHISNAFALHLAPELAHAIDSAFAVLN